MKEFEWNKKENQWNREIRERLKNPDFLKALKMNEIRVVQKGDRDYPLKLMPYENKPEFLFYKGTLPDAGKASVAMVGARACSNYGRSMAKSIARELSAAGVQIISGMARGIDTYSQLGALEGGTPTFAVMGCGVDICYPTENIGLYNDIITHGGGILSEYPPGVQPKTWHFPMRNRIISGLSDKVVVIEAKEKSGSLITVEWALEQGKDVMALPGRIGEKLSAGCNRLIKTGAGIVTSSADILDELHMENIPTEKKEVQVAEEFRPIYEALELQPKSLYEIMEAADCDYGTALSILLKLQLMGMIEQPVENYYVRK